MTNKQLAILDLQQRALEVVKSDNVDITKFDCAVGLLREVRKADVLDVLKADEADKLFGVLYAIVEDWYNHPHALNEEAWRFVSVLMNLLKLAERRDAKPKNLWDIIKSMNRYANDELQPGVFRVEEIRQRIIGFTDDIKNWLMGLGDFDEATLWKKYKDETGQITFGTPSSKAFIQWLLRKFKVATKMKSEDSLPNKETAEVVLDGGEFEVVTHVEAPKQPTCCRGKTCSEGCEFLMPGGKCGGVVYPTYPPQYDRCEFLKNTN